MFFKPKENNTHKYDIALVKKLQEEGKIPKYRIAETKDASGQSTYHIEVLLGVDLFAKKGLMFRTHTPQDLWDAMYPKIEANTWILLSLYKTYMSGRECFTETYFSKEVAKKVIDEQIILLLKDIKVSTSYEEYP